MHTIFDAVNRILSPLTVLLLSGVGIYLSVGTRFFQFRRFGKVLQSTVGGLISRKSNQAAKNGITPFQAVSTALAGTLGTGNIVGVSTALVSGGAGAVFWMVLSAFFGMITKYAEVLLAIEFQRKDREGNLRGGPMYYMQSGLGLPKMGAAFAVLCMIASFGVGNMVQANAIAESFSTAFGCSKLLTGLALAALIAIVTFGGTRGIAKICAGVVPFMAILYLGACLTVLIIRVDRIPQAVAEIFTSAFGWQAAGGGLLGYTVANAVRFGISRGIFTNEAGLGSAPIAHGSAHAESSVGQGMWGIFEVFLDTVVICSLTALVVLTSDRMHEGLNGAALTAAAFSSALGSVATPFLAISIFFFALSSMLGWYYYGQCSLAYLSADQRFTTLYRIGYPIAAVVGSGISLQTVWAASDTLNLLMFLPNIIAVLLLSKRVFARTAEYDRRKKK